MNSSPPNSTDQAREKDFRVPWLRWPFAHDAPQVYVLQTYGQSERAAPLSVHAGLDLAAPPGTSVFSPLSGEVSQIFNSVYAPHERGLAIRTVHRGLQVSLKLVHLEQSSLRYALGDWIEAGDLLGTLCLWPNDRYPTHLHIEMGWGEVYTEVYEGESKLQLRPRHMFRPNANPLVYLQAPADEVPPRLVPLDSSGPFRFRQLPPTLSDLRTLGPIQRGQEFGTVLAPDALYGWVDIQFAAADGYSQADRSVVAPYELRLVIRRATGDKDTILDRFLRMDGDLYRGNRFAQGIYLWPPDQMFAEHSAFVFHLTAFNGEGANQLEPQAWRTEPGEYEVTLYGSDLAHKDVLLATQVVRVLAR